MKLNPRITPERDEMLKLRGRLEVVEQMTATALLALHAFAPEQVHVQLELEREQVGRVAADPSLAPDLSDAERTRLAEHMSALIARFERLGSAPRGSASRPSAPNGNGLGVSEADMA